MIKESRFPSATGLGEVYVRTWIPDTAKPRSVVQLTHGMAEHIGRYEAFASFLSERGFIVTGQDQAGHGKSLGDTMIKGYFGEENGWANLVKDMQTLHANTREAYPDIPYILLGHSMGSFLARTYASRCGEDIDAFIFSGTAGKNGALPIAKWLANRDIKKGKLTSPNQTLNQLAFGAYAKAIPDAKTPFDWLSHDRSTVDAYMKDDNCGFVFTTAAFRDLFDGLMEIGAKDWAGKVPHKPILILSGACDPVGGKDAKGPREVAQSLRDTGHDVLLQIYEGGRHEMLNEPEKYTVYQDILAFLEGVV